MRYSSEITIDLPRDTVVALFDKPENYSKWMKGLLSMENLEGEAGQEGARRRLKFEMGKRKMEMVETITERNLPERYATSYETAGVYNEVLNEFIVQGPEKTLYRTEHYFRFDSWGMKVMAFLMPGAFKKQSMQYMRDFKAYAELEQKLREGEKVDSDTEE
ncbi:SRPBCC family protein [Croceimicrobium sp.]|uniref:SRPBCC family protein n=1 Tax=Croceimicrobium sp. TaxID=2828340 RepID=UPI003BAD409D